MIFNKMSNSMLFAEQSDLVEYSCLVCSGLVHSAYIAAL